MGWCVTYGPCINQILCINIYLDGHGVVEHHRDVLEHFVSWVFNEHYGVAAYNHGVVVIKWKTLISEVCAPI